MNEPIIIQLIADYGVGDAAFAEVVQKLTNLDRSIRVYATSIPAFSTLASGFWIAQFSLVNPFPGLIVYSNTAPRITLTEKEYKTLGGRLAYTRLTNGTAVIAVNVGFCFSFIKEHVAKLHLVNVPNVGSQFRSRDYYPDAVVALAQGDAKFIGAEIPKNTIPDIPQNRIAYIDGYGNLKTTVRRSACTMPVGTRVSIACNNAMLEGVIADETYDIHDGEISYAPGSTGGTDRFMEIWVRGMSAWVAFGRPRVEQDFTVTQV